MENGAKGSLLLVVPHDALRWRLADLLRESMPKVRVFEASNAGEAAVILLAHRPTFALVDLPFATQDALALLRRIHEARRELPIIATGPLPGGVYERILQTAGATAYFCTDHLPVQHGTSDVGAALVNLVESGFQTFSRAVDS